MPHKNTTFFISDLHLDPSQPKIIDYFFYFLEHIASGADALYILGDFFEAYIGDDSDNAFLQSIKKALRKATDAGLAIYLMHGNRDFLIGKTFEHETGVSLMSDPICITLYDNQYLLMHGDNLCTDDKKYQRFRKIVRHPFIKKCFLKLPLSFRKKIAGELREESMKHNEMKTAEIMDVNENSVLNMLEKYRVNTLIHGHTHKPAIHFISTDKQRIVLSAWHEGGHYLEISRENGLRLMDM